MTILKSITLVLLLIIGIIVSCKKEETLANNDKILGVWISIDKSDTLDFADKTDFYKSTVGFKHDLYKYHLTNDSILIDYSGIRMPMVQNTTHKYNLSGNNLTIDFNNKNCFGFELVVMNYLRK